MTTPADQPSGAPEPAIAAPPAIPTAPVRRPILERIGLAAVALVLALLFPALAVVTVLLVVPLAWLAVQSVTADGAFSLEHYRRFLAEDIYWRSFLLTFRIALIVTVDRKSTRLNSSH